MAIGDEPWVISVPEELVQLSNAGAFDNNRSSYTVCRVPTYIRRLKPDKYDCMMLPLGLYNRDFKNATPIDQLKLEVVSVVFKSLHLGANEWRTFCSEVAEPPPLLATSTFSLEKFYHDPPSDYFMDCEVVQSVLTIDAIFIVAFYRFALLRRQISDEDLQSLNSGLVDIFSKRNLLSSPEGVRNDLWFMFENQIPLFLIQNVLKKITRGSTNSNFHELLGSIVYSYLDTVGLPHGNSSRQNISFNSCEHLLACVYTVVTTGSHTHAPSSPANSRRCVGTLSSMLDKLVKTVANLLNFFRWLFLSQKGLFPSQKETERYRTLPSVSHLKKSGISVRGVNTSVSDIQFVRSRFNLTATLYLPQIDFEDTTQTYLLNMCVYEFVSSNTERRELAAYLSVMDDLIDTVEDVHLLRKGAEPVITRNYLGNDRDVADAINNCCKTSVWQERTLSI